MTEAPARHVVAVGSGKGGVGKSTVTLQLGLALAERGLRVGILDADLYGPDIPLMVGVTKEERASQWQLWRRQGIRLEPLERHGVAIMSAGLLLGEDQSLTMAAPLLTAALRQLVSNVDWGERDVLLIDLPPGTADLQQQLLDVVAIDAAIVVVGPQGVAHLDARKFADFLRDANVAIVGGIENMSGLVCPSCGEHIDVFPAVDDARSLWADGVSLLGRVPLDPSVARDPAVRAPAFAPIAEVVYDRLERRQAA